MINNDVQDYISRLPDEMRLFAERYAAGPAEPRKQLNWDGPSTLETEREAVRTCIDEMRNERTKQ